MNRLELIIKNIQHIQSLTCSFDLSSYGLHCIVGKNGVGKTTLIKILQNFKEANFLDKISRLNIISSESSISYQIDNNEFIFSSEQIGEKYILDTKQALSKDLQTNIFTELPFPLGRRFDEYEKLGKVADEFKSKFALEDYQIPRELIAIFHEVYQSSKFDNLKEIEVKNEKYYLIPLNGQNYLREDNFSSGEYMIVQIYKLIQNRSKLIVIDELDISLDAAAQVRFIKVLERLAKEYQVNFLFTVHSLAIMKLFSSEINGSLYYMEQNDNKTTIEKCSYNFIKAELFQFVGYDKIILTEDKMLKSYLEYLIDFSVNCKYKIIEIAGASQTVELMEKNQVDNLFNTNQVIAILDGDQQTIYSKPNIYFIPFESIEKHFYKNFLSQYQLSINIQSVNNATSLKKKSSAFYHEVVNRNILQQKDIFQLVTAQRLQETGTLKTNLQRFLNA